MLTELIAADFSKTATSWMLLFSAVGGLTAISVRMAVMTSWVAGGLALAAILLTRSLETTALASEPLYLPQVTFWVYLATFVLVFAVFGLRILVRIAWQHFRTDVRRRQLGWWGGHSR